MKLLKIAPEIQAQLLDKENQKLISYFTNERLQSLASLAKHEQSEKFWEIKNLLAKGKDFGNH